MIFLMFLLLFVVVGVVVEEAVAIGCFVVVLFSCKFGVYVVNMFDTWPGKVHFNEYE